MLPGSISWNLIMCPMLPPPPLSACECTRVCQTACMRAHEQTSVGFFTPKCKPVRWWPHRWSHSEHCFRHLPPRKDVVNQCLESEWWCVCRFVCVCLGGGGGGCQNLQRQESNNSSFFHFTQDSCEKWKRRSLSPRDQLVQFTPVRPGNQWPTAPITHL